MSFGFSVGDFIAGLELVGTVITSLRESGGAKSEYRELIQELLALQTALREVKRLQPTKGHHQADYSYVALTQAASQCQHTIDAFWNKVKKYQPHLANDAGQITSRAKGALMKVRWSLCRSEDLIAFKLSIVAHTQAILMLMAALQMNEIRACDKERSQRQESLNDSFRQVVQLSVEKLTSMASALSQSVSQLQQILNNTVGILRASINIYQVVCLIHTSLAKTLPAQIDRQQPVYLVDALDRHTPFFLEFVRSSEALKAVLKFNFHKMPSGERKILNGEFVLQDTATRRYIDLSKDWDLCFSPGQRVEMSMLFKQTRRSTQKSVCPACSAACQPESGNDNTECSACGVMFRRIVSVQKSVPSEPSKNSRKTVVESHALAFSDQEGRRATTERDRIPPKTAFDEAEDARCYRRLIVLEQRRHQISHRLRATSPVRRQDSYQPAAEQRYNCALSDDGEEASRPATSDIAGVKILGALGKSVNIATFEQILEMDDDDVEREFSRSLAVNFVHQTRQAAEELRSYIAKRDYRAMSQLAHFVKGNCATLGLERACFLACELQWYDESCPKIVLEDPIRLHEWVEQKFVEWDAERERVSMGLWAFYRVEQE